MKATHRADHVEVRMRVRKRDEIPFIPALREMGSGVIWTAYHINAAKTPVSAGVDKEQEDEACRARIAISSFITDQLLRCTKYRREDSAATALAFVECAYIPYSLNN